MTNIKRANTSGITKTGTAISDVSDAPTIGTVSDGGDRGSGNTSTNAGGPRGSGIVIIRYAV